MAADLEEPAKLRLSLLMLAAPLSPRLEPILVLPGPPLVLLLDPLAPFPEDPPEQPQRPRPRDGRFGVWKRLFLKALGVSGSAVTWCSVSSSSIPWFQRSHARSSISAIASPCCARMLFTWAGVRGVPSANAKRTAPSSSSRTLIDTCCSTVDRVGADRSEDRPRPPLDRYDIPVPGAPT